MIETFIKPLWGIKFTWNAPKRVASSFSGVVYILSKVKTVHGVLSDKGWWVGTDFPKNQLVHIVLCTDCLPPCFWTALRKLKK